MRNYLQISVMLLLATPVVAQGLPQEREVSGNASADPLHSFPKFETLDRKELEAAVTAMFEDGDRDKDGELTLAEAEARTRDGREAEVARRFARIDSDDDGTIARDEFAAWELQAHRAPPPPFAVPAKSSDAPGEPTVAHGRGAGGDVIYRRTPDQPLGAATVVAADANRDGALTLAELLAYQGARFDAADRDGDGRISPEEFPLSRHSPSGTGQPPAMLDGRPRDAVRVREDH